MIPQLRDKIILPSVAGFNEQYEGSNPVGSVEGKFIRIGKLVLFAKYRDYMLDEREYSPELLHASLALCAFRKPELKQELKAARLAARQGSDPTLDAIYGIADAGHYTYAQASQSLQLHGKSLHYDRASAAGRAETVAITQAPLEGVILVTSVE